MKEKTAKKAWNGCLEQVLEGKTCLDNLTKLSKYLQ